MQVRNRIKEVRNILGRNLIPHAMNWRTHPVGQRDALRGLLAEIGISEALVGFETEDGRVKLIDGHLRAEDHPDIEWPVLVLDVSEEEAKKLLLSLDSIAEQAGRDDDRIHELLADVNTESEALRDLWDSLDVNYGEPPSLEELQQQYGAPDASDTWPIIRVKVSPSTKGLFDSLMLRAQGVDDSSKMASILGAVDVQKLISAT